MPLDLNNQADGVAELIVNGSIGGDITSAVFQAAVNELPEDVHTIDVKITTRGGSVTEGHAMYGILRESGKRIITTVLGGAHSAGAVFAQAGDERRMHSNALMMVHGASGGAGATTPTEHRSALGMLEAANAAVASTFSERTGIALSRMNEILSGPDMWMTAREAKAAGFIDTVIEDTRPANESFLEMVPEDVLNQLHLQPAKEPEKPKQEEIEDMSDSQPVAATAKEIESACPECSAEFIVEQLKNDATVEQAKDAYQAVLAKQNKEAEAKLKEARDEAQKQLEEAKAEHEKELAELKTKLENSTARPGVDPVGSGGGKEEEEEFSDPIAEFNAAIAENEKRGMARQKAMSRVIGDNPNLHEAYLEAYRDNVRQTMTV